MSWLTAGCLSIADNALVAFAEVRGKKMIDCCLSALATAWLITFVATTGLFAALAMESAWDRQVYVQALQDVVSADPM